MSGNAKIALALAAGLFAGSLFTAAALVTGSLALGTFRTVAAARAWDDPAGPRGMMGSRWTRGNDRNEDMDRFMDRYRDRSGNIDIDSMHEDMLGGSTGPSGRPFGYGGCY